MRCRIFYTTLTAVLAITGGFVACTSTQTSTALTAPSSQKCQFQVTTTPSSYTESGGSGSLAIATTRDCGWSASTNAGWVSLASTNGQGDATVSYSVAANAVPVVRSAAISVEGQSVQLSQAAAPCRYTLSKTSDVIGSTGGQLAVGLTTLTGCAWNASSDSAWVAIASGPSGNASTIITLNVAPNPNGQRIAHVAIGGQGYAVTQTAPPPAPTPAPTPTPTPTPPPPSPPPAPAPTFASGIIGILSGHCPDLTFALGGTTVKASGQTAYSGGNCGDVKTGAEVDVTGTKASSGAIEASAINITKKK